MILDEIMLNKSKVKTEESLELLEQLRSKVKNNETLDKVISSQKQLLGDLNNFLNNETYNKVRHLEERASFDVDVYTRIRNFYGEDLQASLFEQQWLEQEDQIYTLGEILGDIKNNATYIKSKPLTDYIEVNGDTENDKKALKTYMSNWSKEKKLDLELIFQETLYFLGENDIFEKEN